MDHAAADGAADAQAEVTGAIWFMAGCALGLIGVLIAYAAEPSPPPARLVGRSPEYAMAYVESYRSAGRSVQGTQAIYGCLASVVVYLVLMATVFSTPSTQ